MVYILYLTSVFSFHHQHIIYHNSKDYHYLSVYIPQLHSLFPTSCSKISLPHNDLVLNPDLLDKMHSHFVMGRGGYNRKFTQIAGRGGYNRDVKSSGLSRPSNPSSLTVRSARKGGDDDGRGGYN